jgi:hypothetical protein
MELVEDGLRHALGLSAPLLLDDYVECTHAVIALRSEEESCRSQSRQFRTDANGCCKEFPSAPHCIVAAICAAVVSALGVPSVPLSVMVTPAAPHVPQTL